MPGLTWPDGWQNDAIVATEPYVNTEWLIEIRVGDPATSIDGSIIAGYVITSETGELQIIHDRSGRPDVFPWRLLIGPVLRVTVRLPRKHRKVVYSHPDWAPRREGTK